MLIVQETVETKKMETIYYVDSVGNGGDNLLETDGDRNTLVWLSRTALGAHLRGLICQSAEEPLL